MHKSEKPEARESAASAELAERGSSKGPAGRRSCRVTISIPVVVYGKGLDDKMFYEETSTQVVNAHGGLIMLHTPIKRHQDVMLVNPKKATEVNCHVVFLKAAGPSQFEVGLEFEVPQPRFWGIAFPPPDWNNADRKRPDATQRPHK